MARSETELAGAPAPPAAPAWRPFLVAFAISVLGSAALGGVLFHFGDNVWWLALGGSPPLLAGGFYLGWRMREPEPLYGALLAIGYFGLVTAVLFGGELTETLPDPLPGLATGDSTFFFVSPLLILALGVIGSILGGNAARGARRRGET